MNSNRLLRSSRHYVGLQISHHAQPRAVTACALLSGRASRRQLRRAPPRYRRQKGSTILELIICLPVLVVAVFACVEFGLLMKNQHRLEYSSRTGALIASESATLPANNTAFANSDIVAAIKREMAQAGLDTSDPNILITLKHNVAGGGTLTAGTLSCPADPNAPPTPTTREFVRITLCVDIIDGKLTPNLLKTYGFDLTDRVTHNTTTLRYEPGPTP